MSCLLVQLGRREASREMHFFYSNTGLSSGLLVGGICVVRMRHRVSLNFLSNFPSSCMNELFNLGLNKIVSGVKTDLIWYKKLKVMKEFLHEKHCFFIPWVWCE